MTKAEMNRRLSEVKPEIVAKIERLYRVRTYSARELHAMRIPGTKSLAHINAVFQMAREAV